MPIVLQCPGCGTKYRVPESAAGKSLRCKTADCGERMTVPDAVADEDDFTSGLGEAAADKGEPRLPPVRASASP
jgi:hypothetical protein